MNRVTLNAGCMGIAKAKKSILSKEVENVNLKIVFIFKREMCLICIQKARVARLESDRLIRYIFSIVSDHKVLKLTCQIVKSARHEKCIPIYDLFLIFVLIFLIFAKYHIFIC